MNLSELITQPAPPGLARLSPGECWLSRKAMAQLEPAMLAALPPGPISVVLDDGTMYHVMD
jgi:hypothetical protein